MPGNVEQYSDRDKEGHERRPPVTDEREGDSRQRHDVEIDSDVDEGLDQYPRRDSRGHVLCKRIVNPPGNPEATVGDVTIASNENDDSEESKFFGYHGKDEVALDFRKVPELLDRFSESEPEKPPAADGYQALFRLKVDRLIGNGRLIVGQKVVDAFRDVREGVSFAIGRLS